MQLLLFPQGLNLFCKIRMNDFKLCPKCKSHAQETDLKDVFKCVVCGLIINERLDNRKEDGEVSR